MRVNLANSEINCALLRPQKKTGSVSVMTTQRGPALPLGLPPPAWPTRSSEIRSGDSAEAAGSGDTAGGGARRRPMAHGARHARAGPRRAGHRLGAAASRFVARRSIRSASPVLGFGSLVVWGLEVFRAYPIESKYKPRPNQGLPHKNKRGWRT